MNIDSKNKNDLIIFVKDIIKNVDTSNKVRSLFVSELIYTGLMKSNIILDNIIKFTKKIISYDKNCIILSKILRNYSPDSIDTIFDSFIHHLIHGKNVGDNTDAGGFSQIELYMIESVLQKYKEK